MKADLAYLVYEGTYLGTHLVITRKPHDGSEVAQWD